MSENRQLPAVNAAPAAGTALMFQPGELDEIQRVGKLMQATNCFKSSEDPAADMAICCMKIIAGKEFGLGPFAALRGIHIIKGKPGLDYKVVGAKIKQSGRYDYKPVLVSPTACKIQFFVDGEPYYLSEFTMAQATTAGYSGRDKYKQIPHVMLFARCLTEGANFVCPELFNGGVVSNVCLETSNLDVDAEVVETPAPEPVAKRGSIGKPATAPEKKPKQEKPEPKSQPEPEPATAETETVNAETVDDDTADMWPEA